MSDLTQLLVAHKGYSDGESKCDVCGKPLAVGDQIYVLIRDKYPWRTEDDPEQSYETFEWHQSCDPGTIAADNAIPLDDLG